MKLVHHYSNLTIQKILHRKPQLFTANIKTTTVKCTSTARNNTQQEPSTIMFALSPQTAPLQRKGIFTRAKAII